MVLWEITLGTAYFLGLKRTYRLALRIQRRIISPKRTKIRAFVQRRTRYIFDMALRVHQNIQQRDLAVGKNVGNWILRWLDRMKPSAKIRGDVPKLPPHVDKITGSRMNASAKKPPGTIQRSSHANVDKKSDGRLFASSLSLKSRPFPILSTMMRPLNPTGANTQFRHLSTHGPYVSRPSYGSTGFEGVVRRDIREWLLRD